MFRTDVTMTGPVRDDAVWQVALDWVMLEHERRLDEEAASRLRRWLDAAPDHRAAYEKACYIWRLTGPASQAPGDA